MSLIRQHFGGHKHFAAAVKARILMSFLSVKKMQLEQMKESMCALLEDGAQDGDAWVKVIAELMRTLPEQGKLHLDGAADGVLRTLGEKFARHADNHARDDEVHTLPNAMYLGRHFNSQFSDTTHQHFSVREEEEVTAAVEQPHQTKKIGREYDVEAGSPAPAVKNVQQASSPAPPTAVVTASNISRAPPPNLRREGSLGMSLTVAERKRLERENNNEAFGSGRDATGGKRSRGMAAVDFDEAMTESKKPRRGEEAERKRQEKENKRLEREEKKRLKEKEAEEKRRAQQLHELQKTLRSQQKAGEAAAATQQPVAGTAPPLSGVLGSAVAGSTNALTPQSRLIIEKFLSGDRGAARAVSVGSDVHEVVLNEDVKHGPDNMPTHKEHIIFEMNSSTGKWRKLRRKLPLTAPCVTAQGQLHMQLAQMAQMAAMNKQNPGQDQPPRGR